MREILFKAKRTDNGEWVEGALFDGEQYCVIGQQIKFSPDIENECKIVGYRVERDTICQYTGLTDKNGQKIWENDIVCYHGEGDFKPCSVVKYGEYDNMGNMDCYLGFYMDWFNERICLRKDIGFWAKEREIEVIGNVFDNAELVKE